MVANFGKNEDASGLSPEGARFKDYGASSENNISSISNHSHDGSYQFSMVHPGTNCVSLEDAVGGKTHLTQLHAISGYAYTYTGYGDDMIANETEEYSNKHAASEDASVNVKHSSHSFTSYSASSGDEPYPVAPRVSISDVNLQTKQSRVASTSETPPKIVHKQENTKMKMPRSSSGNQEGNLSKPPRNHQIRYKIGAPKKRGLQSSDFPDGEVDTDSTAAASVAAMKEAMEQAQARLNSARKLMERQLDNNERRKKLGHTYGTRNDEEDANAFEEEKNLREGTANKTLLKEGKQMKDYAIGNLQKVTEVGQTPPDHEESQADTVAAAGSLQMRQGNGFKSSQTCSKSEELCGDWKIEEKLYELVNNEKKYSGVKEGKQEDAEKKLKTTTRVNEVKKRYSGEVEPANEFNLTVRLHKVNTPVERDEIGDNSISCNMTSKEEMRKAPEKAQGTCTLKDSSSVFRDINQKLQSAHEAIVSEDELKKPITDTKASFGETEVNLHPSNNTFKTEVSYHDDEEHNKLHAAKEPCEHDENDKESKETYMTSTSYESEEKLDIFRRTGVQCVHENEMEVTSATCRGEADGELVAPEETYQYEHDEYTRGNNRPEFSYEENECKLETTSFVREHGGSRNLYRTQGKFIYVENDLKSKAAQNGNEVKENSEELKPLRGANYKKQNANCGTSALEGNVKTDVLRSDHTESENGKFKDSIGVVSSEVIHDQFDAVQDMAENKDMGGVLQGSRAENEDQRDAVQEVYTESGSSLDAVGTPGTVLAENSNPDVDNTDDLEGDISIEREYEKEQAIKAKEEREKERERKRDRLAVERAREAHERALSEAWERTERIAVERATAEARQRAFTEARGRAQKASADALEKSLLEKALKEAKLRAERAAVERATAEARERAVEKAIAEKAAADARRRAELLKTVVLDESRKDNEAGSARGDGGIKPKASSSNVTHDACYQSEGSNGIPQIYADSTAYGEDESPLRCKARSERHQRTVERAAKALAEKNLRDVLVQREQAERNRLAELLDADVRRWSAGKEGNLRALLSTLQYILGPESGWQSIPLTDVITCADVKKAYRKATLFVHPDKLQQRGANIQQKYICEKVFDLLKEAWNKFNSEER